MSSPVRAASVPHSLHTVRGGLGVAGGSGDITGLWSEPSRSTCRKRRSLGRLSSEGVASMQPKEAEVGGLVGSSQEPGP